jgi:precorrin-6Y C5,15-methyltransferase (decarboxylating)
MNAKPLVVIGIGDDGPGGLSPDALAHIGRAKILAGGTRHLAFFPDWDGERIVIDADLQRVVDRLQECRHRHKTVVLASGDPLFYGIGRVLLEAIPKEDLVFLPHLSSVQLAFARIKETWNDASVVSLHGRPLQTLAAALQRREAKIAVLTDAKSHPAAIADFLRGMDCDAEYVLWVCENLGGPDERVTRCSPGDLRDQSFSPLNIVVLVLADPPPPDERNLPLLGIPERVLRHRTPRGDLITKREIRLLTLCYLDLHPGEVLWDVGAGSGSVAIEAARLSPTLTVYAIERDPDALRNIAANVRTLPSPGVQIVPGMAPAVFAPLPDPDAVFIGGSGGELQAILRESLARLRPGGRLVLNCITLDSLTCAWSWFDRQGIRPEVTSVQLAHSRPLGELHRLEPDSPIFILRAKKR